MVHLYHGVGIDAAGDGYYVGGVRFATLDAARKYIDAQFI